MGGGGGRSKRVGGDKGQVVVTKGSGLGGNVSFAWDKGGRKVFCEKKKGNLTESEGVKKRSPPWAPQKAGYQKHHLGSPGRGPLQSRCKREADSREGARLGAKWGPIKSCKGGENNRGGQTKIPGRQWGSGRTLNGETLREGYTQVSETPGKKKKDKNRIEKENTAKGNSKKNSVGGDTTKGKKKG